MSLEDMVKSLTDSTCQMRQDQQRFQQDSQKFQQETRTSKAQMSQLASSMSNFENGKGKLPSQVIPNPKKNASAMLLQSGKEVQSPKSEAVGVEDEQVYGELEKEKVSTPLDVPKIVEINPSFPDKLAKAKKEESEKEILDTFRRMEINIPLLDAIWHLSKYAKVLKGLCTNRSKLNVQDKIKIGKNVTTALQRKLFISFSLWVIETRPMDH